jgi:hypothetical protein
LTLNWCHIEEGAFVGTNKDSSVIILADMSEDFIVDII